MEEQILDLKDEMIALILRKKNLKERYSECIKKFDSVLIENKGYLEQCFSKVNIVEGYLEVTSVGYSDLKIYPVVNNFENRIDFEIQYQPIGYAPSINRIFVPNNKSLEYMCYCALKEFIQKYFSM